jgi:hypothetical protein
MKNIDITRDSFDPRKSFSRVLKQQGRVELESDWNEQAAITLRYLRLMMRDLVGLHAGPSEACGFRVLVKKDIEPPAQDFDETTKGLVSGLEAGDFVLSKGRYYVEGLLCENQSSLRYTNQTTRRCEPLEHEPNYRHLLYLDVWEHEVTALEDDDIREVALGGADTAARMKVVWVVRAEKVDRKDAVPPKSLQTIWAEHLRKLQPTHVGAMSARARAAVPDSNDESSASEGRYRSLENQLYRVEIHHGASGTATFKWSRDNGTVAFVVEHFTRADKHVHVTLTAPGRDDTAALTIGDAVEFNDISGRDHDLAGVLFEVVATDMANRIATLLPLSPHHNKAVASDAHVADNGKLILRRWDHLASARKRSGPAFSGGAVEIKEERWLPLEDGIEVFFKSPKLPAKNHYRAGDYWLIPARVATGNVDWPRPDGHPTAQPPHGVEHHYAPLALVDVDDMETKLVAPLTRQFGHFDFPAFGRRILALEGE